ncbi:MAG TPA: hypothetical protein VF771_04890 [Longimicrobiaceae bacterium]
MRKLKLELDDLQVESFQTDESLPGLGTVHAHVSAVCTGANGNTCNGLNTCDGAATCDGAYTCNFLSCDSDCDTNRCGDSSPQISQQYVDGGCI